MAFLFNGQPLAVDAPFTDANGTQYPANWLRLSTSEEREAIGIIEVPDSPVYDQRFFWGYGAKGELIPKDHAELIQVWVEQTYKTVGAMLSVTDWQVIREVDSGKLMDPEVKAWRENVRASSKVKIDRIKETSNTNELAVYVTSSDFALWPELSSEV